MDCRPVGLHTEIITVASELAWTVSVGNSWDTTPLPPSPRVDAPSHEAGTTIRPEVVPRRAGRLVDVVHHAMVISNDHQQLGQPDSWTPGDR